MKKLSLLTLVMLVAASAVNFDLDARRRSRREFVNRELPGGKLEICRKVGRSRGERAGLGMLGGGAAGALIGGAAGGGRGAGIGFGVGALTGGAIGAASGDDNYECYITTADEYYGRHR